MKFLSQPHRKLFSASGALLSLILCNALPQAAHAAAVVSVVNVGDGSCLANLGWSTTTGTAIGQFTCDNQQDMQFNAVSNSDGSLTFSNLYSGMCVDVTGVSSASGALVEQWTCNNGSNQKFKPKALATGQYELIAENSGLCLGVPGSATGNGIQIDQEKCTGAKFQLFKINVISGTLSLPSVSPTPTPSPSATPKPSPKPAPSPSPTPTATPVSKVPTGIQNMQLVWTDQATVDSIYDGIGHDLPGLKWVRIDFEDDDAGEAALFVEQVRKAHQYGMKVLAMTNIAAGDVAGGSFPYPLSALDAAAFGARIRTYMNACKAAGQNVEAWEIGNELDSSGFNSDDPSNVGMFQQAYGRMIQTAVNTIKDPAYKSSFPGTQVITVGFANMMTFNVGGHLPNPPAALAGLKNFNGQNYLSGVDGYGMHVYPGPDTLRSWTQGIFQQYQDAGLTDKPVWITEWGFHRANFPYNGHPRSWANDQWLQYVNGYSGLSFGAAILFNYRGDSNENFDFDIYDGNTLRQDEANVLINWSK